MGDKAKATPCPFLHKSSSGFGLETKTSKTPQAMWTANARELTSWALSQAGLHYGS